MARKLAELNGTLVIYAMGLANAVLALVVSFGVTLNQQQQGTIIATVNALFVLVGHTIHSNAKRTKTVIPAGPIDEASAGTPPPAEAG